MIVKPRRPPPAIVSVPFERADFERVEKAALEAGVPISGYIRQRTLAPPECLVHTLETKGSEVHLYNLAMLP